MKKFFTEPTIEISCFDVEDVITTSGVEGQSTELSEAELQTAGYTVYSVSLGEIGITF